MDKPQRNLTQLVNMSFGFLGIQFGWGLQMANMSPIYEYLGARADQLAYLGGGDFQLSDRVDINAARTGLVQIADASGTAIDQ